MIAQGSARAGDRIAALRLPIAVHDYETAMFRLALPLAFLATTCATVALPARAQMSGHQHGAAPAAASAAYADGEVRKVDKEGRKITLKHGPIASLGMGGMTMSFGVKDPALLDRVKVGDKVRFKAAESGGQLVVTELAPAK
jgi:Cu/Ag efflux protein CusF